MSAPAPRSIACFLPLALAFIIAVGTLILSADEEAIHSASQSPTAVKRPAETHLAIRRDRETEIRRALERRVTLNYDAAPLHAVLDDLRKKLAVNVVIDRTSIADEGIATDQLVRLKVTDVTWHSVLDLLLEPVELDWTIENDVLFISTAARCREQLTTAVYPVGDLVRVVHLGQTETDFTELIDVIMANLMPESWDAIGGPASLRTVHGNGVPMLIVRQSRQGHEQVAQLLADLRAARRTEPTRPDLHVVRQAPNGRRDRERQIRDKLETRLTLNYEDIPVSDALRDLQTKLGVDFVIDTFHIADEGIDLTTTTSLKVEHITARSALNLILRPLQLNWVVRDEVLFVNTAVTCGELQGYRVYDVTDLVTVKVDGMTVEMPDYTELIDVITSTVDPETWDVGGPHIRPFTSPGIRVLVLRQTDAVHEQISGLLTAMVLISNRKSERVEDATSNPGSPRMQITK